MGELFGSALRSLGGRGTDCGEQGEELATPEFGQRELVEVEGAQLVRAQEAL